MEKKNDASQNQNLELKAAPILGWGGPFWWVFSIKIQHHVKHPDCKEVLMLPVMVGNPGAPPCGLETQPSTRAAIGAGRNFCSIMESAASLMSNARNGSESALALRKSLPAVCCCRAPLSQMGHAFALPGACSLIFAAGLKVRSSLGAAEFPFLSLQIPWRQTLTGCLCRS